MSFPPCVKALTLFVAFLIAALTGCSARPQAPPKARFDQPDEAAAFQNAKRGISASTDTARLYANAARQMTTLGRYTTAGDGVIPNHDARLTLDAADAHTAAGWTFLGPGNIGGRTRALLFDPRDPNVMYAAGVSGGIWKSVNGGASWSPIADILTNIAVNSLAIDPADPRILYAGTGEGYFREEVRGTALPLRGNGIFATRDGGTSWQQLPATAGSDFLWVNDLVISARESRRLYAATRSGVWRSNDGGAAWTRVLATTVKGGCLDLALRPGAEGDYLYASCGIFEQATIYRSEHAEGDLPWTAVLSDPAMSRTTIAIAPSDPSIVYALSASNLAGPNGQSQNLYAVHRSDRNGDPGSWTAQVRHDSADRLSTIILTNPIAAMTPQCLGTQGRGNYVPMGWHCNVIAVDPRNPDVVWAAGVDLFRSDDGGKTWGVASYWWRENAEDPAKSFVHADQHVILFHPQYDGERNQTMYAANDGGVFRTDNARASVGRGDGGACRTDRSDVLWKPLNRNYGVTQFYHGAVFPDGRRYLGGTQDNGTVLGDDARGSDGWRMLWGGDGGYSVIDPTDPNILYVESQFGNVVKSVDGGANFRGMTPITDSFLFITPLALDPRPPKRLWIGGRRLWNTDENGRLVQASTQFEGQVSAIAVAPQSSDRVVAGLNDGSIARIDLATVATSTTAWSTVTPRSGFVSSITFHPTNMDIIYATYAGFGGGAHVWRSTDGGRSWSPLDGGDDAALPDIPVHSLAVDPILPSRIYLGTDLGVFVSTDGGGHWMVENTGFAAAVTEWVTIAQGSRGPAVYAFTHGRGAWRAELTTGQRRRATR